jgi:hypothetical protein
MLTIRPIDLTKKAEREAFIRFPWKIYAGDPHWVAPLLMDMRDKLNVQKHPFFTFGSLQCWMAYRGNEPVGRIAAADNPRYNEVHGGKTGFCGFFESIDDQAVANKLFDTARSWLVQRGLTVMHGPASPSSNYDYGLLVEGFDDAPRVLMTYNPAYYVRLWENYGFKKAMGLLAYRLDRDKVLTNEKFLRVKDIARERSRITTRPFNLKDLNNEIKLVKKIYNGAWEKNWGFVPMTDGELDALAKELKMVLEPKLFHFVLNEQGEAVGLAMALLDYNFVLQQVNGRLFPFNFLKFFTQKKKIKWMRVVLLGLLPEYRNKGIDAVLYHELIKNGMELGLERAEASWILEDNPGMNRGLQVVNGEVYKRYNIYEIPIA